MDHKVIAVDMQNDPFAAIAQNVQSDPALLDLMRAAAAQRAGSGYQGGVGGQTYRAASDFVVPPGVTIIAKGGAGTPNTDARALRHLRLSLAEIFCRTHGTGQQVTAWTEEAARIGATYPAGEDRQCFITMIEARFSNRENVCDQAIQEAKQATDFIISGKSDR